MSLFRCYIVGCNAVAVDCDFQPTRQFATALILIGISDRTDVKRVPPNDHKVANGTDYFCNIFFQILLLSVTNLISHRYCSVSDWIQFEETEGSEEKRLNWFEAQAKEKSEKDGERNGEESIPYASFLIVVFIGSYLLSFL